jgi:hypothetical protein
MSDFVKTITSIAVHNKNQDIFNSDEIIKIEISDVRDVFNVSINSIELKLHYNQAIEIVKAMKSLNEQKGISGE